MQITRRGLGAFVAATAVVTGAGRGLAAPAKPGMLDAIVLGAGVAGLNTAWLLEQQGLKVMVLEGRNRVGGRVRTLLDQPGLPEMGFNSMGAGYGRGLDAAKRAGVELYDVAPRFVKSKQELVFDGQVMTREQWAASPANPFPADRKATMPWEMVGRTVREHNPLADWSQWADPMNAGFDVSLHDFLRAQGLSDAAIHLAVDTSPYYGGSSYDISALTYEFADGWVKTQGAAGSQSFVVKGGNEMLPRGMAKLLKGDVLLGREVVAVGTDSNGATVTCRDGSSFRAKRVVCALPFSTLRYVKIDPALTGPQAQAVKTLAYQSISMAFVTAKSPFWESDGLSPSMWTNGVAGTVMAQHFGKTEEEVTGFVVQARSGLADYWDRLGREEATRRIIAEIETIRPAAKGQLVGADYFSWSEEPFNAGDWAYFGPGQVTAFVPTIAMPVGRLHFCGEHTATANRGLEGALESSERVALEVLSA